ncbi:MAG: MerR family transcriptional regulator [Eubacteriales bacterium]|nr:MerR family transcriptional regulator [Eubacteriales bacterium]
MDGLIKIKDVSDRYDITARTLRYYEDMGLISSTRSEDYAYRLYDENAVKRIEQILILRKLNISIKDIQRVFNASGSEVVLDVLSKKVQNIDDEVALLHELKDVVLEFIHQIEQIDFGSESGVKMLYKKAKEIETHLTNVDYIGKPANVGRLLEVAEKLEREPDILIVEMPPCRMVTSGFIHDMDEATHSFGEMWNRLAERIADKIHDRSFMYHDREHQKMVWLFMLEDWMTEADTEGFEIITFAGGLFADALADSEELSEWDRVYKGIKAWLARQEHLELDEGSGRYELFTCPGPHPPMREWNYGRIRYYVPIKLKEEK